MLKSGAFIVVFAVLIIVMASPVFAWGTYYQGGRRDFVIGSSRKVQVCLDSSTRVIFYDSSYREVKSYSESATNIGPSYTWSYNIRTIACPSNAKYISFHLDGSKQMLIVY